MENEEQKSGFNKECLLCTSFASCLCLVCNNYFCDSCYTTIHDKPKSKNHKKEDIDPFIPIDLYCPKHPKDRLNLFCISEKGN